MKVETKFDLYQKVTIKELGLTGTVIEIILYMPEHIEYKIRYFCNNEERFAWQMETDLELINPKREIGI